MATTLSDSFFDKLHGKYIGDKLNDAKARSEAAWNAELPLLRQLLPLIEDQLGGRYSITVPLGVGGVSIVLQVIDTNLEIPRALKFARPTPGRESLFSEILSGEISYLRQAVHPNIIEIYQRGVAQLVNGDSYHFYIMQFIKGAKDAKEYFEETPRNIERLVSVLTHTLAGLAQLHKILVLHGDIKLENILVAEDGHAVISDLGSARHFTDGPPETTLVFTRAYAHPELLALAGPGDTDPNRVRTPPISRTSIRAAFDLYALGLNILRLLKIYDGSPGRKLEPYDRKYLQLMACRMLDGHNSDTELPLGLPRTAFQEIKYTGVAGPVQDLQKFTGQYSLLLAVEELNYHSERTIQTSSLSETPFTQTLADTISHPLMRRLAGVPQLGLISLLYPAATHSRLEHVLGTFTNVVCYCDALYNDALNPLFKQIVSDEDIRALLLAALFHDLGQFPLAHDLEEAAPTLFDHEKISTDLIRGRIGGASAARLRELIETKWNVNPERVARIIEADPTNLDAPLIDRLLGTIISGPIDADKLDYIVRDSANLGVPLGMAIDFSRLLRCLTVIYKRQELKVYIALGIHEKGKFPAEAVAFARYSMFGAVYWHHTSRAVKAMLHRAVWEGMPDTPKAKARYRTELQDFIIGPESAHPSQPDFFAPKTRFETLSQVLPADIAMIQWLADHTSAKGKQLLELLVDRQLFRRLLVVSKPKWQLCT